MKINHLKDQARSHPLALVLGGSAVLLAIGSGITMGMVERHRRRQWPYLFKQGVRKVHDLLHNINT